MYFQPYNGNSAATAANGYTAGNTGMNGYTSAAMDPTANSGTAGAGGMVRTGGCGCRGQQNRRPSVKQQFDCMHLSDKAATLLFMLMAVYVILLIILRIARRGA